MLEFMDVIILKDTSGIYFKRFVKHILTALFLPFFLSLFATIIHGEGLLGFFILFVFFSPLSLILIFITIYRVRYYILSVNLLDDKIELHYYEFGKRKFLSLEISSCEIIFRVPMLARLDRVLILKNNNKVLIRQYKIDEWTTNVFRSVNEKLAEVPELQVKSLIPYSNI